MGGTMNKQGIILCLSAALLLILTNLASAYIIRDVAAERQAEWDRYEEYKSDYIKFNDLEAFSGYVDERNLQKEFGFKPNSYYYVPPNVLNAYYNPPLQGDAYYTNNRGYSSSLYQPSAVKYYGTNTNGRISGYVPSTKGGIYFDHPQMEGGAYGFLTVQPQYRGYGNYGYYSGYDYQDDYSYGGYGQEIFINPDGKEPAFYARIAEPLSGGFYVVGFY
jgi:hypothetical protein